MTEQQKEVVRHAQAASLAALDTGIEEDAFIASVFEATTVRTSKTEKGLLDIEELVASHNRSTAKWFEKLCASTK